MILGQVMQTFHVGGWPTGNGEKWGGYGGVTRRVGLGLVQSHSDGNESHFVSLSVGLERSQWDSEEAEPAADAQPNDHMIDGLIDLLSLAVSKQYLFIRTVH
jgi:hypothetical protein